MSESALLQLRGVAVGYGHTVILKDINFELRSGSFTGLLGANGSGKSTLLKTILGIYEPLAGRISLGSPNGPPLVLGYVPQRESLDPVFLLSSYEVVLMGVCGRVGAGRRVGKLERDWARECLKHAGAADLATRLFSQLSGGQKQRVLLARALAAKPNLLLLDEPISGIDASASQAIMSLLAQLNKEERLTILMVSHDLNTVRRYAQEVIWLHQGAVLLGPVEELLKQSKIEEILHLELS